MELTADYIRNVANLARLSLTDAEVEKYREQLASVFAYMEVLTEMDVADVPATAQVTGLTDVLRADRVMETDMSTRDAIIEQFPERAGDALVVPPVF